MWFTNLNTITLNRKNSTTRHASISCKTLDYYNYSQGNNSGDRSYEGVLKDALLAPLYEDATHGPGWKEPERELVVDLHEIKVITLMFPFSENIFY